MATQGRTRDDGTKTWIAHWREDNGRQRGKTFYSKKAALAWEHKMRQERDAQILDLHTASRETTLDQWLTSWWKREMAGATLNTRENYARVINKYLSPELGRVPMSQIRAHRIAAMRDVLLEVGETPSSIAYAITVLSSALGPAVEKGYFEANPCASVRKPRANKHPIHRLKWPPSPEEIETLRAEFLSYRAPNSGPWLALRSATLVSVMAYAGLRPSEAMGLKVQGFDRESRMLIIEDVFAAEHRRGDTKTHYQRVVELLDVVAEDLELWIDHGLDGATSGWMFPPQLDKPVSRCTHRNWAARPWERARHAVVAVHPEYQRTLGQAKPRDLRSAYVSLLARAGHSDADIAEMSGHSVEVLRRHYMGALRMLRCKARLPEDEQIELARKDTRSDRLGRVICAELTHALSSHQLRAPNTNSRVSAGVCEPVSTTRSAAACIASGPNDDSPRSTTLKVKPASTGSSLCSAKRRRRSSTEAVT